MRGHRALEYKHAQRGASILASCVFVLASALTVCEPAQAQEPTVEAPGACARRLHVERAALEDADTWAELGLEEAACWRAAAAPAEAAAVLQAIWEGQRDQPASSPLARVLRRQRALVGLWALGLPASVPPLEAQASHLLDLGQLRQRELIEGLASIWEAAGWLDPVADAATLQGLRPLAVPRRKRSPYAAPAEGSPKLAGLRWALEAEVLLSLATRDPSAAWAGLVRLLAERGDAIVEADRWRLEASRLALDLGIWEARPSGLEVSSAAARIEAEWLDALSAIDRGDLALARQVLEPHRGLLEAPRRGDYVTELSETHPRARALYWLGRLAEQGGELVSAAARWREVRADYPGSLYGLWAEDGLTRLGEAWSRPPRDPAQLWAGYQRHRGARWVAGRRARFDDGAPEEVLTHLQEPARAAGLDPVWVLALIRNESRFRPGACSASGACGLMQIKVTTARLVARRNDVDFADPEELLEPARNLALGCLLLGELEERFGGDPLRALAAYNAGPGAVERWGIGALPGDLFVERMHDRRTRAYVVGISVRYGLYAAWLGVAPRRTLVIEPGGG